MSDTSRKIKVTLINTSEDHAILRTSDNTEIKWPKDQLPDNLKEGENFYLIATRDQSTSIDPKRILEEILNGEEENREK